MNRNDTRSDTLTTILFDLDGTIIDSSEGIFSSIQYAMEKMNRAFLDLAQLRAFVGPPLYASFLNLGFTDTEAKTAVDYYRENYRQKGMFQVTPYEGIAEVLATLSEAHALYIATSKPEVFAKEILAYLDYTKYFNGIYGADMENKRGTKGAVIAYALEAIHSTVDQKTVMVGDRSHDIQGAKENQLAAIGVLYGFGDRQELVAAGACAIVQQPIDLLKILK
ncbi:hydrolase [Enterococcus sp. RIT-PI-f]|nr:hydrolase [Enterococcus sp. RIT-PI-f]